MSRPLFRLPARPPLSVRLRRPLPAWCAGVLVLVVAAGVGAAVGSPPPPSIDFTRDVRPILADKCFQCHGPDEKARRAGLRLDQREGALARRPGGGQAIVPGRPDRSRLTVRVESSDPARRMPPASSKLSLTPRERQVLRRWVAEGAEYRRHWAFVPPPARVPVPPVRTPDWCRNEIDAFVLARLERGGLRPSPEAGPAEWLRRVTLDLTGLPPTPEEVDAFGRECGAGGEGGRSAYERAVDRLLASPRYGERMATPWLDAARYGDSYGYQSDQISPTWPYRDWVVRAFNENLPYDRFAAQQLAGDLLPDASRETRLATAFNRLHRMTNEGGSVSEEWRLEGVADRVNTFGAVFLGLTLECARCHDHKFDPVSQRDYYSLSAFFNSIDEHGLYDRADIVPAPSLLLPTPEQEREHAAAREAVRTAGQALADRRAGREAAFREWLARAPADLAAAGPAVPDRTGQFDFEAFEGTLLRNRAAGAAEHGQRADEVPLVEGRRGRAALLDGENNVHFPALGRFTRHTPFTLAFWMYDPRVAAEPAVLFQACSGTDTGPHGYDLLLERGTLTARMFRHWPGNAIAVRTGAVVPRDNWTHVAVTYDGSSRAAGLRIYVNGKPAPAEPLRDHLVRGTGQHTLVFGQRFRDRGFQGGRLDDLEIFTRDLTPLEIAHLHDGRSLAAALASGARAESELREYYFSALDEEVRRGRASLVEARRREVAAEDAQGEIAVMREMPAPRPAYVLARGQYDAPRLESNRVGRGTPPAVLPFPPDLPRDRLGLAAWLARPGNPLTARVAVNRVWALLFGRGLVETQENFGLQGKPPTHPELLDWLAVTFASPRGAARGLGWDVKALVRLIVLSSTYRQSSRYRPELAARDPENLLLARGPSQRLGAEAIRDLALAASGLLDERIGGPPVSPYQPGDLWREANTMSPAYRQSVGRDLHRRSLYTVWKRTAPMPNMTAFDAASREVCVLRRPTTSTPLQALVLMNDPQFVEAARVLGERMLREGGSAVGARVRRVFRLAAAREPHPEELDLLTRLYERQRELFARAPAEAEKLLKIGDRKPDPGLPPVEAAAAAMVAQAILSLDAVIWKR